MDKKLELLKNRVFEICRGDASGHDFAHIERVVTNALTLQKTEGGSAEWVEVLAWVHDIGDYKLNPEVDQEAEVFKELTFVGYEPSTAKKIAQWAVQIGFKGGFNETENLPTEVAIVKDADRLDAIGAIGIARAFAYGGSKSRAIYTPNEGPKEFLNEEEYKAANGSSINHFYEKLLLLKDHMLTAKGKELALERHDFMKAYLHQFFRELNQDPPKK